MTGPTPEAGVADVEGWTGEVLEAWRTNHRINVHLMEHISEEGMACTLSTRGGRDVCRQLAHLHSVRVWHLERRARDLAQGLEAFDTYERPDRTRLMEAHTRSAEAVAVFLAGAIAGVPRRRASRKGVATTLAYFIAHDSHHRGNILLTLKQSGHPVPQEARYAIWDWDRR